MADTEPPATGQDRTADLTGGLAQTANALFSARSPPKPCSVSSS